MGEHKLRERTEHWILNKKKKVLGGWRKLLNEFYSFSFTAD
jgi:hypothetical protein